MELTGRVENITIDYKTGNPIISLVINENSLALDCYDKFKEEEKLTIKIDKYKERRSLNANAYFHSLVNRLGRYFNISDDEMKIKINLQYGTIAKDDNGKILGAKVPKGMDIKKYYPYAKWYKDDEGFDCYLFYKRTHELNTLEFSQLLNGVVQECKDVGIQTLDDIEIQRLINEYEVSNR